MKKISLIVLINMLALAGVSQGYNIKLKVNGLNG